MTLLAAPGPVRLRVHRPGAGLVSELRFFAESTRWPWALAAADYGRAMVAPTSEAPGLFESALAHHRRAARPYDAALVRLAYGEFLRRGQHRVDARIHLRLALETFEDLQAEPLVARTTQELRASGETAANATHPRSLR